MKTKLLNILAALALIASSLAIHQSAVADGAYRIGFNVATGGDPNENGYPLIGAVVGEDSASDAQAEAQAECLKQQDAQDGMASTLNNPKCNVSPNTQSFRFPAATVNQDFKDQCIVAYRDPALAIGWGNIGVGMADNCEQAGLNAINHCATDACESAATPLNTAGALYLIDGDTATVCEPGRYTDSTDNTVPLVCEDATTNGNCATNTPLLPILIDGNCVATCEDPDNEEANDADGVGCRSTIDCGDNSTRDGTTCTCNAGFDSEDGKNCMSICGANSEFQAGEEGAEDTCTCESGFEGDAEGKNCMSIDCGMNSQLIEGTSTCECISDDYLGDAENKNCVLQITQGETFVFSGITNGHTAATAANIANADAGALQITINTEVDGIDSYTKIGGDDALVLNGAVVSFAEISVAAATYSIFIAATNEESVVVATISLYLAVAPIPPETPPGIPSSDTSGKQFLGIIGTGMVAIAAYWLISDWVEKARWTPSYAFANNNGNVSYSVGSRWTAAEDNWRVYWQTRQNNDTFAYGSGIGYNNGILSAAMNSESQTDKTAIDLDLAANKTVGLWNIGGGYNFDMELSETETETKNRLNAKVRYTMDKWILSANAKTDGKRGTARINYSYRF